MSLRIRAISLWTESSFAALTARSERPERRRIFGITLAPLNAPAFAARAHRTSPSYARTGDPPRVVPEGGLGRNAAMRQSRRSPGFGEASALHGRWPDCCF